MNTSVNRYIVAGAVALALIFGGDVLAPIVRVFALLFPANVPAL